MFNSPNRRASCHRPSLLLVAAVRAIRFHRSGELSTQNKATWVWSAVRAMGVTTPSPPRRLTSRKSRAYRLDVTGYAGTGRNCATECRTQGVTAEQPGTDSQWLPAV